MCDQDKCTPPSEPLPPETLRQRLLENYEEEQTLKKRQTFIAGIRDDLLDSDLRVRVEGMRRLYGDLARRNVIWFDRLGHVAQVEAREGHLAGVVELALVLACPDEWPPELEAKEIPDFCEREDGVPWPHEQRGGSGEGSDGP